MSQPVFYGWIVLRSRLSARWRGAVARAALLLDRRSHPAPADVLPDPPPTPLLRAACIVFSKDRPLQLEACLRSIRRFAPYDGPCYRCLFPAPPPAELAPSCGANGVLGVLPGTMGLLQATEVIKLIVGSGEPLIGRLLMYDALDATTTELKVRRDPECPICSRDPDEITDAEMGVFPDYEAFCAAAG